MLTPIISLPITTTQCLICCAVALILGLCCAVTYGRLPDPSKSFAVTLTVLPLVSCALIIMVNGELGMAITVAGVFTLTRFRSAPASGKDIALVMLTMFIGIACATGYVYFALMITAVVLAIFFLLYRLHVFEGRDKVFDLKIKVPEDVDYTVVFESVFEAYTSSCVRRHVKTTNLGSLNEITYRVVLKNKNDSKKFLDELRCLNGNLPISLNLPSEKDVI